MLAGLVPIGLRLSCEQLGQLVTSQKLRKTFRQGLSPLLF
ncbi:hypothetical protein CECT5772_01146 [Streptococcus equi subsp. ruminatorum CECT 5772]|uniref:Uncharacterized protein n=1 Tax=Streptococcus equi subsp. ruminatorum CECT 5772 TaxID=1051981 RepID=A0A922T8H6_9STRE|nr:hypothetical protein CECT5772_01146 [Streptococcus equi subsp. ruminatorum CECT 5772]